MMFGGVSVKWKYIYKKIFFGKHIYVGTWLKNKDIHLISFAFPICMIQLV